MNRTISSSTTFLWKFIFSGLWIAGFGYGTIASLFSDMGNEIHIQMLLAWIIGTAMIYISVGRSKKVILDDDFIYISNFFKSVKIPISNIYKTTDIIFFSPRIIIIHFKEPTEFGKRIHFIASLQFMGVFSQHPVIKEIQDIIKENK